MGIQHQSSKRKQYSSEFKREAVGLVTESGLSIAQAARDLGLNDNMVSRWKKEAEKNGQRAFPGQGHPQDEELSRLRREVAVLRQEREILKKPSASSHSRAGDEGDALSIHSRASRPVLHDYSVEDAGCRSQRFLRMAAAARKPACPAKGTSGGANQPNFCT